MADPQKKSKKAPVIGWVRNERTGPFVALLCIWFTVGFLSIYGAPELRDEVTKNDATAEWHGLLGAIDTVDGWGQALGRSPVRSALESLRAMINDPVLVLEAQADADPDAEPQHTGGGTAALGKDQNGAEAPHPSAPSQRQHLSPQPKTRVLVIGASSIQFALGVELERRFSRYNHVRVKRFGKLATGLSRPDFFNWPKKFASLAARFKPDLVVANFGGNGAQNIPSGKKGHIKFGTEAWNQLYAERVQEMVEVAKKHGADLVFLGMPNMRKAKFARKMKRLNAVQRSAAEKANVLWISTWEMSSTKKGQYRKSVRYKGKRGLMRTSDGVHYRRLGAAYVVDQVLQKLERIFLLPVNDPELAQPEAHRFYSQTHKAWFSYVAFTPRELGKGQTRPGLYLFPGEKQDWANWPNPLHRTLQRLAEAHQQVLLVMPSTMPQEASFFQQSLMRDVTQHLPVSSGFGLLGPNIDDLHHALVGAGVPHRYKKTTDDDFEKLNELIAWYGQDGSASQTPTP